MTPASSTDPAIQIGEDFFRRLCEQMGMALIATDGDLRIRTWNTAAGRIFGASADQMIGTPVLSVMPHERRVAAERMLRRAVDAGESSEIEFHSRDKNGAALELSGTITPVVGRDGARVGASICVRDITRRMHLQAELHESQKMAALGEMAGAIAHHFNNILGGVVTSIDFAADNPDAAVAKRVLAQTNRALIRASALVNGLLAFAEGGPRTDDLSDLTELIHNLTDDMERTLREKGIEFMLSLPELPVVPVPRVQLSTILRNIVQNAVEAMPDGGKLRMAVSLTPSAAVIAVSDTGKGLSAEAQSRIFEPFWTTKQPDIAGVGALSGLGLAIAHGLAQVIGASIDVTSHVGKGSTFTVSVPRVGE